MISAGVGGAITGRGAHLLIIDDPVKNAEAAMSETIRKRQWEWWLATARSRLEPGALVIVLMTRWHEGDLGGRMLAESANGGDPVREIRLPALAEEADPLGREKGEALWPARYSIDYHENTRKTIGPYWWAAMYQGRPTPDEGGIFDRRDFRHFELRDGLARLQLPGGEVKEVDPDYCTKATYVDLAVSEKQTADYTVALQVWVSEGGELLVQDVIRKRIPGPAQVEFLAENHIGTLKIEAIGYQTALIQALRERGLPGRAGLPRQKQGDPCLGRRRPLQGREDLPPPRRRVAARLRGRATRLPGRRARRTGRCARLRCARPAKHGRAAARPATEETWDDLR